MRAATGPMTRRPPGATPLPYTTLFRSVGPDLTEHLNRIVAFNRRGEQPTRWALEVHASPDFFQRMLHEHPGNVVILSGRDRKSTRLNSSHRCISYAVFCLKKQSATGVD